MNSEPAFPANHFDLADGEHGLTMRDYFAAQAMQMKFGAGGSSMVLSPMARLCYEMADAMMEARK